MLWLVGGLGLVLGLSGSEGWVNFGSPCCIKFFIVWYDILLFSFCKEEKEGGREEISEYHRFI